MTSDEVFTAFLTALDADALLLERGAHLTDVELRMLHRQKRTT